MYTIQVSWATQGVAKFLKEYFGAGGAIGCPAEVSKGNRRNFQVQVNPVQQGAADLGQVRLNLPGAAVAFAAGIVAIATPARIQRAN